MYQTVCLLAWLEGKLEDLSLVNLGYRMSLVMEAKSESQMILFTLHVVVRVPNSPNHRLVLIRL